MNKKHIFIRAIAILTAILLIAPILAIIVVGISPANSTAGISHESAAFDTAADTDYKEIFENVTQPPADTSDLPTIETESVTPTPPSLIDLPVLYKEVVYVEYSSISDAETFVDKLGKMVDTIHSEVASELYTKEACVSMTAEINRLNAIIDRVEVDIDNIRLWNSRLEEYPYATRAWMYLKSNGLSNAVCAGIMGNLMTETGGHTLAINPYLYSSSGAYYGIAQWASQYHPKVQGVDFDEQCKYLMKTIEHEFNTFGSKYKKGFCYEDFLKLTSPEDAALAFAKCYERCGTGSYAIRQNGALIAYEYFT